MGMADSAGLRVRDTIPADAASLATLVLRARATAMPGLHEPDPDAAVARWLTGVPMREHRMRVATSGNAVAGHTGHGQDADHGVMGFQRHPDPARQRRGIGSVLIGQAIAPHAPAPLSHIRFARNAGSRAFHEAHGFRPIAFRDGAANEEGEPDIVYRRDAGPVLPIPREDQP